MKVATHGHHFGFKKLEVWQMARELVVEIHRMTTTEPPMFEMHEDGSQIRRSIKSVKSNIVEGYGRRRHKAEYLRFLDFAYASTLETIDHLETLQETGSLTNQPLFNNLHARTINLGKAMHGFIRGVETHHNEDLT